jgi:uncharacterized protein
MLADVTWRASPMIALIVTLVLAFVLGFAAHRASICTVRAVAEIMHSRTAWMASSIGKTILWVVLVTLPFFWLTASSGPYLGGWALTLGTVLGGFLFGIGAGINGACAYSTMARLMDGEGRMLATLAGFAAGVAIFLRLIDLAVLERPVRANTSIDLLVDWALVLVAMLSILALFEAARLWRSRPAGMSLKDLLLAPQYRLSTAALVIGLTGAGIYLLFGSAGYTSTFEVLIEGALGASAWPATGRWLVLVAVLAGMLASTLQRGSFRLTLRPRLDWLRNFFGGVLMGTGVALAPGGNDTLVLYSVPTLSPHALPAFTAMAVGIAAGLLLVRAILGFEMRVSCRGDVYQSG